MFSPPARAVLDFITGRIVVTMKSILITGCNRGLGLGLVKALLKSDSPPKNLITTCRSVDKASVSTQYVLQVRKQVN